MQSLLQEETTSSEDDKITNSFNGNIRPHFNRFKKTRKDLARFKLAQRVTKTGSWELDVRNDELKWSDEFYRILEKNPDTFENSYESYLEQVHPDDREMVSQAYKESLKEQSAYHMTHRLQFPDGRIKYVEVHFLHFHDDGCHVRSIGTIQDVTDRETDKRQLAQSLQEKEVLLAEIHHRLKNNLSVVSGLLQLQCFEEEDPRVEEKLQESLHRVKTIARIHEQLYQTNQFSTVDLSANLEKLTSDIIETLVTDTKLELNLKCKPVKLDMRKILPASLIANEVITNVVKYAFPKRDQGEIEIILSEQNNRVRLIIRDDGVGLPEDFGVHKNGSLGLSLIETFTQQLKGDFAFRSDEYGTTFTLSFAMA